MHHNTMKLTIIIKETKGLDIHKEQTKADKLVDLEPGFKVNFKEVSEL